MSLMSSPEVWANHNKNLLFKLLQTVWLSIGLLLQMAQGETNQVNTYPYYLHLYATSIMNPTTLRPIAHEPFLNAQNKWYFAVLDDKGSLKYLEGTIVNPAAANPISLTTIKTDQVCSPAGDPACHGGTGSLHHPLNGRIYFGTNRTDLVAPRISSYHIPTDTFTTHTTSGFGNVVFIELLPWDLNQVLLLGSNNQGVGLWNMSDSSFVQINATSSNVTRSYFTALCLDASKCLLEARDGFSHYIYSHDPSALDTSAGTLLFTVSYSSGRNNFTMRRLTAINAYVIANSSAWISIYDATNPSQRLLTFPTKTGYDTYSAGVWCPNVTDCTVYSYESGTMSRYQLFRSGAQIIYGLIPSLVQT